MLGKVLLIAPYRGLATQGGRLARRRPNLDVSVRTADLEDALPLLDWARAKGIDLIISRGGTAAFLERRGTLPVIEISVSGYDLFRLTSFIKNYQGRVSLIGFPNVCSGVTTFSQYLDVDIPYTVVHDQSEVHSAILKARDEGRVVIGDTVTVRLAEEAGVKGLLITSGPESINLAFDMAENLLRGMRRANTRRDVVETCLDSLGQGTALCDAEGTQVPLSHTAPLGDERSRWRDRLIPFFAEHPGLPEGPYLLRDKPLSGEGGQDALLAPRIGGSRYLLFHGADVVGDRPVRHHLLHSQPSSLFQLAADAHHLSEPARVARDRLGGLGSLALVGEPGTGRTRMLRAIQTALYGPESTLLCGTEIRQANREALRQTLDLLAASTGSLAHIIGVERLRRADQELLARELTSYGHGVVLLFQMPPSQLARQGVLSPVLADLLETRVVRLPSVREDPKIFESTVLYALMEANARHGKTLSGFSEEAMRTLLERPWPGNFEELSRFVDSLVRDAADGADRITDIPRPPTDTVSKWDKAGLTLDPSLTLEEMEAEIIQFVLNAESGNKSAAAERLGIGRSTLWRKMRRTTIDPL
ncbi:MAG: PrpR N-terminal domain-containing protein [Rhodospirillum sp.]|nr:PrpR N-terminal domain-containing protein [Rhodospirillum sp.]MCF8489602.1 PrpR N-terminal domain-containing protein [Rhodospirillum sp.]MCF8499633.1 PrpR N-terminal domain-containing protein [Rhodospirillum sp.]